MNLNLGKPFQDSEWTNQTAYEALYQRESKNISKKDFYLNKILKVVKPLFMLIGAGILCGVGYVSLYMKGTPSVIKSTVLKLIGGSVASLTFSLFTHFMYDKSKDVSLRAQKGVEEATKIRNLEKVNGLDVLNEDDLKHLLNHAVLKIKNYQDFLNNYSKYLKYVDQETSKTHLSNLFIDHLKKLKEPNFKSFESEIEHFNLDKQDLLKTYVNHQVKRDILNDMPYDLIRKNIKNFDLLDEASKDSLNNYFLKSLRECHDFRGLIKIKADYAFELNHLGVDLENVESIVLLKNWNQIKLTDYKAFKEKNGADSIEKLVKYLNDDQKTALKNWFLGHSYETMVSKDGILDYFFLGLTLELVLAQIDQDTIECDFSQFLKKHSLSIFDHFLFSEEQSLRLKNQFFNLIRKDPQNFLAIKKSYSKVIESIQISDQDLARIILPRELERMVSDKAYNYADFIEINGKNACELLLEISNDSKANLHDLFKRLPLNEQFSDKYIFVAAKIDYNLYDREEHVDREVSSLDYPTLIKKYGIEILNAHYVSDKSRSLIKAKFNKFVKEAPLQNLKDFEDHAQYFNERNNECIYLIRWENQSIWDVLKSSEEKPFFEEIYKRKISVQEWSKDSALTEFDSSKHDISLIVEAFKMNIISEFDYLERNSIQMWIEAYLKKKCYNLNVFNTISPEVFKMFSKNSKALKIAVEDLLVAKKDFVEYCFNQSFRNVSERFSKTSGEIVSKYATKFDTLKSSHESKWKELEINLKSNLEKNNQRMIKRLESFKNNSLIPLESDLLEIQNEKQIAENLIYDLETQKKTIELEIEEIKKLSEKNDIKNDLETKIKLCDQKMIEVENEAEKEVQGLYQALTYNHEKEKADKKAAIQSERSLYEKQLQQVSEGYLNKIENNKLLILRKISQKMIQKNEVISKLDLINEQIRKATTNYNNEELKLRQSCQQSNQRLLKDNEALKKALDADYQQQLESLVKAFYRNESLTEVAIICSLYLRDKK